MNKRLAWCSIKKGAKELLPQHLFGDDVAVGGA